MLKPGGGGAVRRLVTLGLRDASCGRLVFVRRAIQELDRFRLASNFLRSVTTSMLSELIAMAMEPARDKTSLSAEAYSVVDRASLN